ncbi:MAG: immunity 22 family protein [Oceanospirillaceae bacterium]|nr:immunity 22 family protein [Oceanospirillaceae bacterium]
MALSTPPTDITPLPSFEKHGKVSVWCSTISYDTIPDSYFEEDDQGLDAFARNFSISEYDHENMETNGVASGTASVKSIIEDCSYSSAYGEGVIHKINKMGHRQVSWIILLFDFEYRNKLTKIHEDDFVQYVGSFVYDMDSISLAEQQHIEAQREEKRLLEASLLLETQADSIEATAKPSPVTIPVTKTPPSKVSEPEPEKIQPKGHNPWLK